MKLTVIGKYGPYVLGRGNATSCYLVEEKSTKLVLDFGSGALANLSEICKVEDIDAIFISHIHFDHTEDLLILRYYLEAKGRTITIYTSYTDSEWYRILFNNECFKVVNIDKNSVIKLKDMELSFFETVHAVTNFGIKITANKQLIYTGDTVNYERLRNDLKGGDTVLIDAMKPDNFNGSHMKLIEAIALQKELGSKFIITHFGDFTVKKRIKNIKFAEQFTEYEV